MTQEDRAIKLAEKIRREAHNLWEKECPMSDIVVDIIRQAQAEARREAIEEAAKVVEGWMPEANLRADHYGYDLMRDIAYKVRKLAEKEAKG